MSQTESLSPPGDGANVAPAAPAMLLDPAAADDLPRDIAQALPTHRSVRRHVRAVRLALNVLLFLALMYTVTLARALLIPLVLAAFLGLALNPLVAARPANSPPTRILAPATNIRSLSKTPR